MVLSSCQAARVSYCVFVVTHFSPKDIMMRQALPAQGSYCWAVTSALCSVMQTCVTSRRPANSTHVPSMASRGGR
jgi:hypothetical protein